MSKPLLDQRAKYTKMSESTQEDWDLIGEYYDPFAKELANRILQHLNLLKGDHGGFAIDRLEHSLQTATRAYEDERDEEYVVCALLHDVGDTLGSYNHADVAAAILQPFVSEENHWMVAHHGIFQGYYFFQYLGLDRNMRDQYRDNPHFRHCAEFCEKYDQNSFDPDYTNMSLESFIPMVERVFEKPKTSIYQS